MGKLLQVALAESAGGAAAGVVADTVLYAIDSAKVRAQSTPASGAAGGFRILFRGLAPTILLGSVPVFGTFFLIYAPIRDTLQESGDSRFLPIASAVCAVPATIIGVPADVLKKRLVLGIDPNFKQALSHVTAQPHGWRGLFAGWHVNLIRDLPFAAVKVGLYEYFVHCYLQWYGMKTDEQQHLSATGASLCGVASGVCCAILTCPLDVVNTRIKAGGVESTSIVKVASDILKTEGVSAFFRGVAMRSIVLGVGSSIFWPIQRKVAQTLQPYERCPMKDRLMEF
jgi:hypothetical protein